MVTLEQGKVRKARIATLFIQLSDAVSESMYDFIVTFATMLVALYGVFAVADGIALLATVGFFVIISVYLILLIMRILRRLDNSWTIDEVGEVVARMEEVINKIERNV
jgi:membrane protein implicated in regulation of membrane protease activity